MKFYTYKAMKEKKDRLFITSVIIALTLYFAFSITFFACASGNIRESVVRLHILANSNSQTDQQIKLKVRDALLEKNTELISEKVTPENAQKYFLSSKAELEKCANQILKENGLDYTAKITLCEEYYTTRAYESLTFPAGKYTSVKVILGNGEGKNWWCVMFPPLCVPAASGEIKNSEAVKLSEYLDDEEEKIITSSKEFKIGFKILELYEYLFK